MDELWSRPSLAIHTKETARNHLAYIGQCSAVYKHFVNWYFRHCGQRKMFQLYFMLAHNVNPLTQKETSGLGRDGQHHRPRKDIDIYA